MDDQRTYEGAVGLIDGAVTNFLQALGAKEVKLVVADVLRLLDLRKQLAHEGVREVRVRWVDTNPAPFVINI